MPPPQRIELSLVDVFFLEFQSLVDGSGQTLEEQGGDPWWVLREEPPPCGKFVPFVGFLDQGGSFSGGVVTLEGVDEVSVEMGGGFVGD